MWWTKWMGTKREGIFKFNQGRKMTKKIKKYEYGKKIKNF
jgi:hypothetical protein